MHYLVTGGAGFIGCNFVKLLFETKQDCKVTVLDKLTYAGRLENLREFESNPNYMFVKGDICDEKAVEPLAKEADIILNFAAESHVDRSIEDPFSFIHTDVYGTGILLDAARKHRIEKFVQISTDEVYGSVEQGYSKENDEIKPSSPYSASKAGADRLAYAYHYTYGLPVVITRSSNNYGPNQYPEKIIPLFITNLLCGKKVPLYGDGKNKRDWIHVMDNCKGIVKVMENGKNGEAYNVGAGNELTNIELTKMILKELGKGDEMIEYVKDRLGHDKRYALDCSKANSLGWKSEEPFEERLAETVQWYKNNEWWWKPLVK
jgi:dTDP-glucose 4,6-dehydratase